MRLYIKGKIKRFIACGLVSFMGVVQPACAAIAPASPEIELLNDRAADIIGSNPLLVPGLLIPGGLKGKGVVVGIADSGLDKGSLADLPLDLQSSSGRIPRIVVLKSYSDRALPDDPIGHGTHMAGTIIGSGEASGGQFRGIAPGASLYFQALLDKDGKLSLPGDLKSLFLPAYLAGVRVHVDGWGEEGDTYGVRTAQSDQFVYEYPDFLPIFGAGNKGSANSTLTNEAQSKNALTVGASQSPRPVFSPEAIYADRAAGSSSRGPTSDGRIKPDLVAPGSAIISVCSRLNASNYTPNPAYTLMGGTSMAASVTGGAAALLQEYLKSQGIKEPSSALFKALLINGAKTPAKGPSEETGFGFLDLAGTVLPLHEKDFKIAAIDKPLKKDATQEYHYQVSDTTRPLKATLAWVDPVAPSGSQIQLVNNLDLEIVDPKGNTLLGNDFKRQGLKDSKNNVEQVVIDKPVAGDYLIRVRASRLSGELSGNRIGLVYGQALRHAIVQKVQSGASLLLADGSTLDLNHYSLKGSSNSGLFFAKGDFIIPGSDLYISSHNIYSFCRSWESGGVQLLKAAQGTMLVEMNSTARQGGYFFEKGVIPDSIQVNGEMVNGIEDLPAGVKVRADINPGRQTIWSLEASYKPIQGFIDDISLEKQQLKILLDPARYSLTPWTAVSSKDILVSSPDEDKPYGSFVRSGLDSLSASTRVSMMVSNDSREVQNITVQRDTAIGTVLAVDNVNQAIKLDDDRSYTCFPGVKIYRDGQLEALKNIEAGDKISASISGNNGIIQMEAYSRIVYGRVVYFNPSQKALYIFDNKNNFKMLNFTDKSKIYKGGLHFENSALNPGDWVRMALDGDSNVLRLDMALKQHSDIVTYFRSYNPDQQTVKMSDGSTYKLTPFTQITKAGLNYPADLILAGEKIKIATISGSGPGQEVLAQIEVDVNKDAAMPDLQVDASQINGVLVIRGTTSGDRIVVFRQDGTQINLDVNANGSFGGLFPLLKDERSVRIIALDRKQGGIAGIDRVIKYLDQGNNQRVFVDIEDSPDKYSIEELARQGVVSGAGNASFLPEQSVSRAEFLTMLGRARRWPFEDISNLSCFNDSEQIPLWALSSVYFAHRKGLISGYPDGRFGPQDSLNRSQMVVILGKAMDPDNELNIDNELLSFSDNRDIPSWALPYFKKFYDQGWLELFRSDKLEPYKALTRGEAARFIQHLLFPASRHQ